MKQKKLRRTDLTVSEICLGADHYGSNLDRDAAFRQLDKFREVGGNFVDTANIYCRDCEAGYSRSERILGEYLKSRGKSSLVIATKGGHPNPATKHISRLSRAEIEADLDESLRELGLDCIDFYWLHRDAPETPIGEILEILDELRKLGKIRYYGGSNYSYDRVVEGEKYAKAHGLQGFSGISNMWAPVKYNSPLSQDTTLVCYGGLEMDRCFDMGLALVPYHSTAKGWFAKRAVGDPGERLTTALENATNLSLLEYLKKSGVPVQTALLRYIIALPQEIVPITSTTSEEHLDEILSV